MCLVFVACRAHPRLPLVVAANRDEYHARPTAPLAFWDDAPGVLAGRDLEAGGTWMGVTRAGRFAAITNYRDPASHRPGAQSRGGLVSGFLTGADPACAYLRGVVARGHAYNGFSLLVFDGETLAWCSNRATGVRRLAPGVHGLSNHLLDTPWPKVADGRDELAGLLAGAEPDEEALFALLDHREPAAEARLPDTGVGRERERWLSSRFVLGEAYGTRSSTVLFLDADGGIACAERSFGPDGVETGRVRYDVRGDERPARRVAGLAE